MKFSTIFIEEDVKENAKTVEILNRVSAERIAYIQKVEDVFGRVKKPYLQKRESLNLFLGRKEGELVKPAPDAYGLEGDPHFYFIHAYNCIYECEYCYLQGYFDSPDIVLFVNHDEIVKEMERVYNENANKGAVWFHAGEFSDSLSLGNITNEFDYYWPFFKAHPNAMLELRTKSANIKPLRDLEPLPNTVISFSLSPEKQIKKYDHKTASLKGRLKAIKELSEQGYPIGLHLDPVIYDNDFLDLYTELLEHIVKAVPESTIRYISLGVVRFTKDVFLEVQRNYPESDILTGNFIKSFDNKIRYKRPHRLWILKQLKSLCLSFGIAEEKIYLCMENE